MTTILHRPHLDIAGLPTPLAQVARRVNTIGLEASADSFLIVSYLFETSTKLLAVALHAALFGKAPDHAYRIAYELVRADGLGVWEQAVRTASSLPAASFLPPDLVPVISWLSARRTKPDDQWFSDAVRSVADVCNLLEIETGIPDRKPTVLHLLSALVQIRNKTKAHGAVGPSFFTAASAPYLSAVRAFLEHCPVFQWPWMYLYHRAGIRKGIQLRGDSPHALPDAQTANVTISEPGVHFWPEGGDRPYSCSRLLLADPECREFLLPNGAYSAASSRAEFIDYASGRTRKIEVPHLQREPAPLPPSETHGLEALDVQSNVFGNLPPSPRGYVQRIELQTELERRLKDKNHPIITLHGRGGIGKTSLALWMAHKLAAEATPAFEAIIWFSARDVDLRHSGPKPVRPAVITLEDVARDYGRMFGMGTTVEDFAAALQHTTHPGGLGNLFIFDNFETLKGVVEVHRFLDTYTHLPNKVLITSRERAFKADFPIEVQGMSLDEARELVTTVTRDLGIEGLVDEDLIRRLYDYSEGHPYVMRVLIGEMAKEGRFVPPQTLMPRRLDIVNAVFERSFNKLTDTGRRVFLTVANWRSAVSELALIVVLGRHGLDVESGIEECLRLSLISSLAFADAQRAFAAPQLARVFGRKKLDGDPDRLLIQDDLSILQRFGVVRVGQSIQVPEEEVIRNFVEWCIDHAKDVTADSLDGILQSIAELWPRAWEALARFRRRREAPQADVEYALRRAVEENPTDKAIVLQRAEYARTIGDESTWLSSRIQAVELDPNDTELIMEVANELNQYIFRHSAEIPQTRRGVYLASVREIMAHVSSRLDATGLSRLAWLYLHEGNDREAARYTKAGLKKDPNNVHCLRLAERLAQNGIAV